MAMQIVDILSALSNITLIFHYYREIKSDLGYLIYNLWARLKKKV